jgi:hypothetical protein
MKIEINLQTFKGKREELGKEGSILLQDVVLQQGRCIGLLYMYTLHCRMRLLEFLFFLFQLGVPHSCYPNF